jgi:hypothetical protein
VSGNVIDGDQINQGITMARSAVGNAVITSNVVRIGATGEPGNSVLFFVESNDELSYGAKISRNDFSGCAADRRGPDVSIGEPALPRRALGRRLQRRRLGAVRDRCGLQGRPVQRRRHRMRQGH